MNVGIHSVVVKSVCMMSMDGSAYGFYIHPFIDYIDSIYIHHVSHIFYIHPFILIN